MVAAQKHRQTDLEIVGDFGHQTAKVHKVCNTFKVVSTSSCQLSQEYTEYTCTVSDGWQSSKDTVRIHLLFADIQITCKLVS